ncbi:LysR family transcriptional regulator [Pediococcus argentinicus]|nr:LysR family transcriptional regulator [Pediococcus argentinicus]NKZ22620.1 LysR family transcriptional regulator [Pediococcus argentinicus]
MELRLLKYFLVTANEENISRAATILHITQPTLSRQIRELEQQLDTTLFTRNKNTIKLTEAGIFLKSRAKEIIDLNDALDQEFSAQSKQLFSGNIRIGSIEANSTKLLVSILKQFVQTYPKVTFDLFDGNSEDIKTKLDAGLIDVAILLEPVKTQRYKKVLLPQTERWGFTVPMHSTLAKKDFIQASDLSEMNLAVGSRDEVKNMLSKWARRSLDDLHIMGTMNLSFNMMALVESGFINALTIEGATSAFGNGNYKFVPLYPELKTNCILAWKDGRTLTPTVSKFIDVFRHAAKA